MSVDNIGDITAKGNDKIVLRPVDAFCSWNYREPKNLIESKIIDRISLNVYPETELITKLDNYISKTGGTVYYKTPCGAAENWCERHDPITIYFKRQATETDFNEIVRLVSPHTRKAKKDVMLGKKLADGIFTLKEPDENEVSSVIARAKKLDLDDKLIKFMEKPGDWGGNLYARDENGKKCIRTTPGVIAAYDRMLDDFEKLLVQ